MHLETNLFDPFFQVKMKAVLRCLVALLFTYEAASLHAQNQPGDIVWKKNLVEESGRNPVVISGFHSTVCLDKIGNLLILPHDGNPVYVDRDGNLKWYFELPAKGNAFGSPAYSTFHDAFYFSSERNRKILAIKASNGNKLWEASTETAVRTTPAINEKYIVYGDYNTKYFCRDIKTGKKNGNSMLE